MSDSESSRSSRSGSAGEFIFVKQSSILSPYQTEIFQKVRLLIPDELKITDLDESECLKLKQKPQNTVFLLANFDGKVFVHLKSLLCCIVGPPLLLSCIENAQALPKSRTPVFSDHMKNVVVCCTNVDREKRDEIYELIERMSGKFKRDFEEKCNFLVAGAVGSQKYEMASQRNIPIVTDEWVHISWHLVTSGENFDPKSQEFWTKYKCPPFVGLNITISGLRADERRRAERDIQANGGTYSGDMKMGETTHLISMSTQGAKYDAACKWNVKVVSYQWLNDCVTRGVCLNENLYPVGKNGSTATSGQKSSTPTGSGVAVPRFSLLDPNCSIISRKDPNCTEMSSVSPGGAAAAYCVNETIERSTATFLKPKNIVSNAKKNSTDAGKISSDTGKISSDAGKISSNDRKMSASTENGKTSASTSHVNESTSTIVGQSDSSKNLPSSELTPLEDLDLTITTTGDFLNSCRIYLNGFESKQMEKLKKIVNAGGGERSPTLNERCTHVVLTGVVDKFVKDRLNSMRNKPAIVTAQWLVRCFKSGKLLSVKEFFHADFAPFVDDFSPIPVKNEEENKSEPVPPAAIDVLDDLMLSQYIEENQGETNEVESPMKVDENPSDFSTFDPYAVDEKEDDRIFVGKSFFVIGFNENEEKTLIENMIEENGGLIRKGNSVDFAVAPLVDDADRSFQDEIKFGSIVTNCWVEMCIERKVFLPVDGLPLFKPIKISSNCKILNGCVICISQYTGAERDALKHLAETLGAKTQEHFSRLDKKDQNILACTHLIFVRPEGTKFLKAAEWKIPAVNVNWLIKCALTLKKIDENEFLSAENELPTTSMDQGMDADVKGEASTNENHPSSSSTNVRNKKSDGRMSTKILTQLDLHKSETKRKSSLEKSFGADLEFDTPSKFTDPNKTFRPNFDLTEGYKHIKERQNGKRPKLESPSVTLERNLAIAVETTKQAETWLQSPAVTRKTLSMTAVDDMAFSFDSKKNSLINRVNLGKQLDKVLNRSKTSSSIVSDDECVGAAGNQSPAASEASTTSVKENRVAPAGNSDSQGFKIGWDDPNQKQQRAKIQPLLKPNSEPTQNLMGGGDLADVISDDDDLNDVVEIPTKKPELYCFMLTSADDVKQMCIETIQSLNGRYLDSKNFSADCTHLIVGKPTRNEKLLAGIATGKWILHPSYLAECRKANRFIKEDDYEWGGEGTSKYISQLQPMSQSLAKCCKRWRVRLENKKKIKPYDGWNVVLYVDRNIEAGLKSLLEHGGASICKKDFTPSMKITHVFMTDRGVERPSVGEMKRLKNAKAKFLKPEYLAAYLIQDPINEKEFYVN